MLDTLNATIKPVELTDDKLVEAFMRDAAQMVFTRRVSGLRVDSVYVDTKQQCVTVGYDYQHQLRQNAKESALSKRLIDATKHFAKEIPLVLSLDRDSATLTIDQSPAQLAQHIREQRPFYTRELTTRKLRGDLPQCYSPVFGI